MSRRGKQPPGRRRQRVSRFFYRWHRRIGIVAAAFVIVLSLTGLLLVHADDLALSRIEIGHPWITGLYDVELETAPLGSRIKKGWLIWIDGRLYLNGRALTGRLNEFIGAVTINDMIAAASENALLLLTRSGKRVERLGPASLPGPVSRIGVTGNGRAAIRSGGEVFTTQDFLSWSPAREPKAREPSWSVAAAQIPGEVLRPALAAHGRSPVSLHRLLLDIHSGRILGPAGAYLADGAAIAFLLLAGSGIVLWIRR